jgi:ribosome-associated protein
MKRRTPSASLLEPELEFITSRSSGPGGQNVNKLNTKVTLRFNVHNSAILTDDEKTIIAAKLASRITTDGVLLVVAQDKRSQLQNKESAVVKLDALLSKAFAVKKKRKATKPSRASVQERIDAKKKTSEKKKLRQKPL